jgi:Intein splicing domain
MQDIHTLDAYLARYGKLLARQAEGSMRPLHIPGRDPCRIAALLRKPFEAQAHLIAAGAKALRRDRSLLVIGECGTGKTIMGMGIAHSHANGRPYRGIVMAPGQLCQKWERELKETLPGVQVVQLDSWRDCVRLHRENYKLAEEPTKGRQEVNWGRPRKTTWYIIARDRAKLGAKWRAAFVRKPKDDALYCPKCGQRLVKKGKTEDSGGEEANVLLKPEDLAKRRLKCHYKPEGKPVCGEALWQYTSELKRFEPAKFIHKRLPGFFDYAIFDECFPADTPVTMADLSRKPIASIRPGDVVLSYAGGRRCQARVTRVVRQPRRERLLRVVFDDGQDVHCTPGHRFYVNGRWLEASRLRSGDAVTTDVRTMRQTVPPSTERPGQVLQPPLLHRQQEAGQHGAVPGLRKDVPLAEARTLLQSSVLCGEEEDTEDVQRVRQDLLLTQAEAKVLLAPLRPALNHPTAVRALCRAGLARDLPGIPGRDGRPELADGATGFGGATHAGGGRDRREVPPMAPAEVHRPPQGSDATTAWLDGGSCHQPGHSDQRGDGRVPRTVSRVEPSNRTDDHVYDLTVDGTHCYFASGVLVHNCHEEKSADSAQANALGSIAAASKKVLALSGTIIGGYADHVRPLLLRLSPTSLIQEGFGWRNPMEFSETYGRIELRVTERDGGGDDGWGEGNRQSRGKTRSTSKYTRPGIMPTLFGRHLMRTAVFLGLDEVAANLPSLEEIVLGVPMDEEIGAAYQDIQATMEAVIKEMVRKGNRKFLGSFLQTLLAYPDHPYGWGKVGYYTDEGAFVPVVEPPNFHAGKIRPKEEELLKIIDKEVKEGRQVWVYTTMTGEKDVADRLLKLITKRGYRAEILRSTVELKKREEWIAKHGPQNQVIISHPKLVETGLDLFDKYGGHNFSTLIFYQTGYNLFTLRQASRRSWRIGQKLPCRVYYLYYDAHVQADKAARTMQARAMSLMGKKLSAAHAIEGKFSSDGLVALSGDDGVEMALAKSLADQIDEGCPTRAWVKVGVTDGVSGRDMNVDDFVSEMAALTQDEEWLFPEMEGVSEYNPFPASAAAEAELALAV